MITSSTIYYILYDVFGAFILLSIFNFIFLNKYQEKKEETFLYSCVFFACSFLFDAAGAVFEVYHNELFSYICNNAVVCFFAFGMYEWCMVEALTTGGKLCRSNSFKLLVLVYFAALCLFDIFYTDFNYDKIAFKKSFSFHPIVISFQLISIFLCIKALILSFYKKNYHNKFEYRRLFIFLILRLVLPSHFDRYLQGASLEIFAITFSAVVFYTYYNIDKNMIDSLTGLSNKNAFEKKLQRYLDENVENFSLIMFDVFDLKSFNQVYGREDGDKLLLIISDSLKRNVPKNIFISRYRDDYFCILADNLSDSEIKILSKKISNEIAEQSTLENPDWRLKLNFCTVRKDENFTSIPDFLSACEKQLKAN